MFLLLTLILLFFFYLLGPESTAADVAGDGELGVVLPVVAGRQIDLQLVQHDGVADLEAGGVPGPGTLVAGVQQAVADEDEVAAARTLPGDLVELPLLDELPPRLDQLPVPQPGLQTQHPLELVL